MKLTEILIKHYTEIQPGDIEGILENIIDLNYPVRITVTSKDKCVKSTTLHNMHMGKTVHIINDIETPVYILLGLKENKVKGVTLRNEEAFAIPIDDIHAIEIEKEAIIDSKTNEN